MKNNKNTYGDIAVIGISGRFPQADNLDIFWKNLALGKDSVRSLPESRKQELEEASGLSFNKEYIKSGFLDTVTRFEPGYFSISEEEARSIDPQHRLALELVEEAIQDAGYNPGKFSESHVGVFMASSKSLYGDFIGSSATRFVNGLESAIAGRIAYTFNFHGPTIAVDTACSSSLTALHYACLSLINGECDSAVTGGVNIELLPFEKRFLESSPILSKSQCLRAFDKNADGTLGGEGGGILVLKMLDQALEDGDIIHAVIKGSGVNSDGRRTNGVSAPSQYAQAELINRVIERSGIDPLSISYLETHGTGTVLGDPIEVDGISIAFCKYSEKKQYIPIGSVKSNVGHLDTAAGIAGVIKVILSLKNKKIPPSLHFLEPNPFIDFENSPVFVNNILSDWNPGGIRRAGVTSLGLIGTNAHVILEEAPVLKPAEVQNGRHIFTLSAGTPHSLDMMKRNLEDFLIVNGDLSPGDVAYTLNTGRRLRHCRWAVHAAGLNELTEKLAISNLHSNRLETHHGNFSPVFIYPDLHEDVQLPPVEEYAHPVFKEYYNACTQIAGNNPSGRFFALQHAASQWFSICGIIPQAVFGIGIGEFSAAVIKSKGKMPLDEALRRTMNYEKSCTEVDKTKLNDIFNKMVDKKYNLFICFGSSSIIDKAVLPHKHKILYLPLDLTETSFYTALSELYMHGISVDWNRFYKPGEYRRVSLPPYAFDRKSYFKCDDLSTDMTAQLLEKEKIKLSQGIESVTFDEILSIFQSSIADTVDMSYDFEENGGDSLTVMAIVENIKKQYDTTIDIDLFYTTPTVEELIEIILEKVTGKNGNGDEDIQQQEQEGLPPSSKAFNSSRISSTAYKPANVLITGAAGFLGSHLLNDLVRMTNANIYCLSRGDTTESAEDKILKAWNYYFPHQLEDQLGKRVFIVKGDITISHLGLESKEYRHLGEKIDTLIHCAADVRHFGKYEHFERTNVEGTRQVIDFCLTGREKRLYHMSTMAVLGIPRQKICFKESDLDVGQGFDGHVYGRSKFEAERLIEQAKSRGLKASIFRVGNLVGRFEDGVFQKNLDTNELYNQIKAITMLGKIPSDYVENREVELTPVDLCSKGILNLMLLNDTIDFTFHLIHPHYLPVKKLIGVISKMGLSIEEVDYPAFSQHVKNRVEAGDFEKEISRIFYRLNPEEEARENEHASEVTYDSSFTKEVLAGAGFSWPELDTPYIERMLRHCEDTGYIAI